MTIRTSRIHNKTEEPIIQTKYWEFYIKNTTNLLSAIGKMGLFYGVLEILIYIWKINFMPSGLSLSDGVIFIFTALTIGITTIISAVIFGCLFYFIYYVIMESLNKLIQILVRLVQCLLNQLKVVNGLVEGLYQRFHNLNWNKKTVKIILPILTFAYINYEIIPFLIHNNLYLFFSLYAIGLLLFFIYVLSDSFRKKKIFLPPFLIILLLFPDMTTQGELVSYAMKALGIRHENTAIELSNANMDHLRAIAHIYGFSIDTCTFDREKKDRHLLMGSSVLWNGIGSKSLIEIRQKQPVGTKEDKEIKFSIELDAAGIWPIRGKNLPAVMDNKNVNPDKNKECGNPQPKPEKVTNSETHPSTNIDPPGHKQ